VCAHVDVRARNNCVTLTPKKITTTKVVSSPLLGGSHSQVRDAGFAHGAGDGLHRRAQRVEQRGELPGALRPAALLHHEAGHGHQVGVEGCLVQHGGEREGERETSAGLGDAELCMCELCVCERESERGRGLAGNTPRLVHSEL